MSNNVEETVAPVEEVDDDMPEMEDVPEVEAPPATQDTGAAQSAAKRTNKMEKKNKKALLKSGLKEFPDVEKVSIQAGKLNLAIDQPDVFRSNDTFVIFGQPRIEDSKSQQTKDVLQNLLQNKDLTSQISDLEQSTSTTAESEETEDAEGIQEKDIEVVMKEASVSRGVAIKAIKENNGDVVDAVVSLSQSK
jgi:nascent polypeptide-associated complex subunit alpha